MMLLFAPKLALTLDQGSETVNEYLVADEPETIAAGLESNCKAFD